MKQKWLPEFDRPDVDEPLAEPVITTSWDDAPVLPGVTVLPGQRALFSAERQLVGQIEAALATGRFEEARGCRDALAAREGTSATTRDLEVLDVIGVAGFWDRPLPQVVSDWVALGPGFAAAPDIRRLVHEGGLARLTERSHPAEIVQTAPSMLAPLTNWLCASTKAGDDVAPGAATLLRDALLDGCRAEPGAFDDARLADLLAEDYCPSWLACLGALRRLWPVPSAAPGELTVPATLADGDEDEGGRQFWACLRVTVSYGRDEPAAMTARKQMKQLHPGMHGLFMRGGVRRT